MKLATVILVVTAGIVLQVIIILFLIRPFFTRRSRKSHLHLTAPSKTFRYISINSTDFHPLLEQKTA